MKTSVNSKNETNITENKDHEFFTGCWALFIFCLVLNLGIAFVGWERSILDHHAFRQAQTAIAVREMVVNGPGIYLNIPVFGPPWEMPFEFPVYQWTVWLAAKILPVGIEVAGRLASLFYFYISLPVFAAILRQLEVNKNGQLTALSLILINPIYLFWTSSFLIESTAVFFAALFVYTALNLRRPRISWIWFPAATAFAILAAIIKITAFGCSLAFLFSALLLLPAHQSFLSRNEFFIRARKSALPIFVAVLGLIAGMLWTKHADAVKLKNSNPVVATQTSGASSWMIGSFKKRFSPSGLAPTIKNAIGFAIPGFTLVALSIMAFSFIPITRHYLAIGWLSFIAAPAILFGLFSVHDYYWCENTIWLLLGIGGAISVSGISLNSFRWPFAVSIFICLHSLDLYIAPNSTYFRFQRGLDGEGFDQKFKSYVQTIKNYAQNDQIPLLLSSSWSPAATYAANAKSYTISRADVSSLDSLELHASLTSLLASGHQVHTLIIEPGLNIPHDEFSRFLTSFKFSSIPNPNYSEVRVFRKMSD